MEQRNIQLLATDPRSLWTPAELPNAQYWWRADQGVTVAAGQVSAWQDQISGLTMVQSTGANQPDYIANSANFNDKPTLQFVAADATFIQAPSIISLPGEDLTLIVVGRGANTTNVAAAQLGSVNYARINFNFGSTATSGTTAFFTTTAPTTTISPALTGSRWLGWSYDNAGSGRYFFNTNGTQVAAGTYNVDESLDTFPAGSITLLGGRRFAGGSFQARFDGEIAEMIITKAVLTQEDRDNLQDYMYLRYGIGVSTLVEKVYLDTYPESPLLLNMQIDDYQELPIINSDFSRTFRIPGTGTNNKFFEAAFNINSTDYDVSRKVPCDIIVDGEFFRRGQIRLNNIFTNEFSDRIDYEIFFLGEAKDFAGQVGEGFLNSLLCFDLNHQLLMSNIVTSWNASPGTTNGLLDGNVLYPLVDMGYTYDETTGVANESGQMGLTTAAAGYGKPFSSSSNPIQRNQFRPWLRAKYLIDKIFELTDYTYTSNFFNSNRFDQMYINATGNTAQATIDGEIGSSAFEVLNQGSQFSPTSGVQRIIPFPIEVADPSDVFNFTTFTAIVAGSHTFVYDVQLYTELSMSGSITHELYYRRNIGAYTLLNTNSTTGTALISPFSGTFTLTLAVGDTIALWAESTHTQPAVEFSILEGSFSLTQAPFQLNNPCALLQDNVKIIDFFKSVINQFKLVVAPDPNNAYNLIIEPYNDYIGSGTLRDWTKKLDTSKDYVLQPIFFNNTATVRFAYNPDADKFNLENETKFKEVYGTYIFDSAQELLNAQRNLSTVFSATPMTSLVGAIVSNPNFIMPRLISEEPDEQVQAANNYAKVVPIRPNLRILFYNGLFDGGLTWYYASDLGVATAASTYPLISPYEAVPTAPTSLNLNWENEPPYYIENVNQEVTSGISCFDEYWSEFIEDQYDPFARKFIGYFVLDHYDLKDFQFKDVIFVKDTYYRVLKIENVPLGEKASVKVELLKLLDYVPTIPEGGEPIEEPGEEPI